MEPSAHIRKARRLEVTLGILDAERDSETIIETCMLAGTHYLNAMAHKAGLLDESQDLLHSDKPRLDRDIPADLTPAFEAMKFIEDLRPSLVRGAEDPESNVIRECLARYDVVRSRHEADESVPV